jgi:glycosyltransferase involved in cell wall biosynthesis
MGGSYLASLPLLTSVSAPVLTTIQTVTHNNGPWTKHLTSFGVQSEQLPSITMPGRDGGLFATAPRFVFQSVRLAFYLRRKRVNIVHANEESVAAIWLPACWLSGAKLVWQQHGVPTPSRFIRFMRKRCDFLVAASEFIKICLRDDGREADAVVINSFTNNQDAQATEPAHRETLKIKFDLPADRPVVAFVGSLSEQKRPKILIAALQHISQKSGFRPKVLVFGDDRSTTANELAAETTASDLDVTFMGYRSDLSEWLQAVDILAAPAINEGYGRALVEAMLSGAVVIAANSGGHCEIITNEKNGLLTPPDDPVAMGDALLRVMSDPMLRKNLAHAAYSDVCGQHSDADYVASFEKIYSEL